MKIMDPGQSCWKLTNPNYVFNLDKFIANYIPNPYPGPTPNSDPFLIWLDVSDSGYLLPKM